MQGFKCGNIKIAKCFAIIIEGKFEQFGFVIHGYKIPDNPPMSMDRLGFLRRLLVPAYKELDISAGQTFGRL